MLFPGNLGETAVAVALPARWAKAEEAACPASQDAMISAFRARPRTSAGEIGRHHLGCTRISGQRNAWTRIPPPGPPPRGRPGRDDEQTWTSWPRGRRWPIPHRHGHRAGTCSPARRDRWHPAGSGPRCPVDMLGYPGSRPPPRSWTFPGHVEEPAAAGGRARLLTWLGRHLRGLQRGRVSGRRPGKTRPSQAWRPGGNSQPHTARLNQGRRERG